MKEKIKVLIADDHPAVRLGVKAVLQLEPNIELVGEASNGDEALELLAKTPVDLVMIDLKMPGKDGMENVQLIRKTYPAIKILVFSIFEEQYRVLNAMRAGADGYLVKSADSGEIVKAIAAIMRGEKYLSKEVADKVIYNVLSSGDAEGEQIPEALSKREEEVLRMLTRDNSYAEIAKALGISKRTVDTHRYNISKKLGIKNIAGLIRYALNNGLT